MDITLLIQWLVVVVLATGFVWLGLQIAQSVKVLNPETRWILDALVETAVDAAEQRYLGKDGAGKSKYDYAMAWLRAMCSREGITWNETIVDGMIEARLRDLARSAKQVFDK